MGEYNICSYMHAYIYLQECITKSSYSYVTHAGVRLHTVYLLHHYIHATSTCVNCEKLLAIMNLISGFTVYTSIVLTRQMPTAYNNYYYLQSELHTLGNALLLSIL